MQVGLYEEWMKPQIAYLFSKQYKVSEEYFAQLITNFYEHQFQKDKCIRIVAIVGDKVVGFQSFFFWSYQYENKIYNSYQSGNSLVHPDYRGKGIFQKMLNYLNEHREELKIDFIIGFPIDASIGSLLRNGWLNLFQLQWYIKIINPFSLFVPLKKDKLSYQFPYQDLFINESEFKSTIKIINNKEFNVWRSSLYDKSNYFSFHYNENEKEVLFSLKINVRIKIIKELIIGNIIRNNSDIEFIKRALSSLIEKLKKNSSISILTIAMNPHSDREIVDIINKLKFRKINKQIYFCIKPFVQNAELLNKTKWIIYRGDIDTW